MYDNWGRPTMVSSSERYDQRPGLERWLTTGGLLVTHERLFRGMEAHSVLYLTGTTGAEGGARSALMRATAALVMVTRSQGAEEKKIGEAFDIVTI